MGNLVFNLLLHVSISWPVSEKRGFFFFFFFFYKSVGVISSFHPNEL
jgi:hypothetical protein